MRPIGSLATAISVLSLTMSNLGHANDSDHPFSGIAYKEFCEAPALYLCEAARIREKVKQIQSAEGEAQIKYTFDLPKSIESQQVAQLYGGELVKTFLDLAPPAQSKWANWYRRRMTDDIFTKSAKESFSRFRLEADKGLEPAINSIFRKSTVLESVLHRFRSRTEGYDSMEQDQDLFTPGMYYVSAKNGIFLGSGSTLLSIVPFFVEWNYYHESVHSIFNPYIEFFGEKAESSTSKPFQSCFKKVFGLNDLEFSEAFADVMATRTLARAYNLESISFGPSGKLVGDIVDIDALVEESFISDLMTFACKLMDEPRDFVSGQGHLAHAIRVEKFIFGHPDFARMIGCDPNPGFAKSNSCFH